MRAGMMFGPMGITGAAAFLARAVRSSGVMDSAARFQ